MTSTDTHALKVISHSSRIVEHLRKNIYLYLFFILILLKLICFAGFSIDQLHLVPQLGKAFYMVFAEYVFRPIFYCCIVLGFLSFSFLFKGRGRGWFLVLVNLFFSWLLLVDIWYLRGFNAMPSLHLLQQGSNLDNLSGSIFPLIHWIDLLFVIDLPILFFLLLRKSKNLKSIEASTRHFVILFVSCLILIFSVMPLVRLWERIFHLDPISPIIDRWEPRITRHNLSPIGYHIVTAYSFFMENKTLKYSTEDLAGIKSWYAENREDLPNNRFAGIAEGMNLIVIQVESLEAFPLQHKINGQEVTPVLNGLLKHAFYFTNFYEQVGNGMSSDGDLMLNTSIYPVTEGATFFRYPFTTYNTFPKVLRKMGYFTSVYHPDNGSFWNWLPLSVLWGLNNVWMLPIMI